PTARSPWIVCSLTASPLTRPRKRTGFSTRRPRARGFLCSSAPQRVYDRSRFRATTARPAVCGLRPPLGFLPCRHSPSHLRYAHVVVLTLAARMEKRKPLIGDTKLARGSI